MVLRERAVTNRRIADDRFPQIEVTSAVQLWEWLGANHGRDEAVWFVTWKKSDKERYVSADEVLDALTAYGWTDGIRRRIDDYRVMQVVSPRRARAWMRSYQVRAEELIETGRVRPAGQAAVDLAKATGAWDAMKLVDDLEVPDDLAVVLANRPPARANYDAFAPSTRRNILGWVASAVRPQTRAKRIQRIATDSEQGLRTPTNG